jgi:hypothetical protein
VREHEVESFGGSQTAEHVRDNDQRNTPGLRWGHVARDIAVEHRSGPAPAPAASAEKLSLSLWSPEVGATRRHSSR